MASGCVNQDVLRANEGVNAYMSADYGRARELLRPLAQKTDENFVLNNARLGMASLPQYHLDDAAAAFYTAYETINATGVNDPGRTALVVLANESVRIWKGEPYERAMLNFYLGLVYYMRQDYANARGAFENSLFKLRDYGGAADDPGKFNASDSNFALAYLMLGNCWLRLDRPDLAEANFDRVRTLRPDLAAMCDPQVWANANVLVVADYGLGPRKVTDEGGAIIGFAPHPVEAGPIPLPRVIVDGRPYPLGAFNRPPIDLLVLAQDRKWQSLDTIRAVKSTLGSAALIGGLATAGLSRNRDVQAAGLGVAAIGLLLKATSQADVRQWEMLPRSTFVLPLRLEPGARDVTVDFPAARGLRQTWRGIDAPATGQATYYLRMQRFTPGPFSWPPNRASPGTATPNRGEPVVQAEALR